MRGPSTGLNELGLADLLLVVKVSDKGEISELYFGPFAQFRSMPEDQNEITNGVSV